MVLAVGLAVAAIFEGTDPEGASLRADAFSAPALFVPTKSHRVLTFGAVDVVIIAYQDPVRTRLVPKLAGRLKSLGCKTGVAQDSGGEDGGVLLRHQPWSRARAFAGFGKNLRAFPVGAVRFAAGWLAPFVPLLFGPTLPQRRLSEALLGGQGRGIQEGGRTSHFGRGRTGNGG